ncbi:MAG TPA: choice-of-anchor D domain-containing protein, partial [Myxococcaceae bacterium]|nr:choice-of-anchor D domain-containing protein [Myxococcaceae bacterium]
MAVLFLGLLIACGPTEEAPRVPTAGVSLATASQALITRSKTITWGYADDDDPVPSTACLQCRTGNEYACFNAGAAGWTKTFTNTADDGQPLVPSGYLVTAAKAEVYGAGRHTGGSTNVGVKLNALQLGATFQVTNRACTSPTTDCAPVTPRESQVGPSQYFYTSNNSITLVPDTDRYCASHVVLTLTLAERHIEALPQALNFGNQKAGTTSAVKTVTVKNTGEAPLRLTALSTVYPNADGTLFTVTPQIPANSPIVLAPLTGQQVFSVTFRPGAVTTAPIQGVLTITNDSANAPSLNVPLSGSGVAFNTEVSPRSLPFGEQPVGAAPKQETLTVTNIGSAILDITHSLSGSAFYSVNPSTLMVNPGTSETLTVTFNPTAPGGAPATLTLTSTPQGGGAAESVPVSLTGTGVQPTVALNPTTLAFGEQRVGATPSPTLTVTVTNAGSGTLTLNSPTFTGMGSSAYSVTPTTLSVPGAGGTG